MARREIPALALVLCAVCSQDARAGGDAMDRWAQQLQGSMKCSEPAAQLARFGEGSLPSLEKLAVDADPQLKETITAIISTGLLKSMQLEALENYAELLKLVEPQVERGFEIAAPLAAAEQYDSGEVGWLLPGVEAPELTPPRRAVRELVRLRGFAVPAAQRLAHDRSPASRQYAADVLIQLGATSQRDLLLALGREPRKIVVSHGDCAETISVGENVLRRLHNSLALRDWLEAENDLHEVYQAEGYVMELCDELHPDTYTGGFPVINALRQEGKTLDARTWEQYWEKAGPLIEGIYTRTRQL